jgi:Calcineurin-like phosphoesterase
MATERDRTECSSAHRWRARLVPAVVLALLAAAWLPATAWAAVTVWAVGDGADSGTRDDAVTAMIASRNPDTFLYLGDVYESGTASEFANYYDPGFGRLKSITRPTPGNHEWPNRSSGYDPYWGPGFSNPHYYGFDLGGWHLVSLNSEEPHGEGSAELAWLRGDLAGRSGNCTIAYWHRPRYSAGSGHGDGPDMDPVWQALAGHAAIVLAGHDHDYQRLKPIDGITSWVVGTGGHSLYSVRASDPRLAAWNDSDYGALRLQLSSGRADYAFVTMAGAVLDQGSVGCQSAPPATGKPATDVTAPVLSRLGFTKKWHRRGRRPSLRGVLRYTLSEPARVTFKVKRRGGRKLGTLSQTGKRGRNRKRLSGRLSGRRLRRGRYKIVLQATDRAGNRSRRRAVRIRVR